MTNLAESSKKGYSSKKAVLPMMMMMMMIYTLDNGPRQTEHIDTGIPFVMG
jgi:hypothetical protein